MTQIDNEKFGDLIRRLRKEKHMTQKELAQKLFVSDKTVSKWERGAGMPGITLLLPLAEALGVTVTELLKGERIADSQTLKPEEVDRLLSGPLKRSAQETQSWKGRLWKLLYGVGALSAAAELFLLFRCGLPWEQLKELMKITAMMLLFGVCLCFLIPRQLPPYYDQNKIDYFTQGPFRIHMPGLSFSNRNWFYISRVLRIFLLAVLVLYPLACCILFFSGGADLWDLLSPILLTAALAGMAAAAYAAARKHR